MKTADIIILDFGSQYTQLIARRLREQGVYAELLPFDAKLDVIKEKKAKRHYFKWWASKRLCKGCVFL